MTKKEKMAQHFIYRNGILRGKFRLVWPSRLNIELKLSPATFLDIYLDFEFSDLKTPLKS